MDLLMDKRRDTGESFTMLAVTALSSQKLAVK